MVKNIAIFFFFWRNVRVEYRMEGSVDFQWKD